MRARILTYVSLLLLAVALGGCGQARQDPGAKRTEQQRQMLRERVLHAERER